MNFYADCFRNELNTRSIKASGFINVKLHGNYSQFFAIDYKDVTQSKTV